ncbi:MAG: 16S rRNA methyltransferase [Thermosphaera sp.]
MYKLRIVILEAGLELVPKSIANHPSILKNAARRGKKPSEVLLDVSIHYPAMKKLPDKLKRGRPDIVHTTLLEALESPLNKKGLLEVFIHTYGGDVIFIDPSTRIPKNYNRFVGLMEQLLSRGRTPPDSQSPLLRVEKLNLKELVRESKARGLLILREECSRMKISNVAETALKENLLVGIGGFPHGDFRDETLGAADYCYSIYPESLTTWIVSSRLISSVEFMLGIL